MWPIGPADHPGPRVCAMPLTLNTRIVIAIRKSTGSVLALSIQLRPTGKLELNAAVVILLHGRGKIKIGELNLGRATIIQFVKGTSNNGIICDFDLVTVFEDQYRIRLAYDR